MGHYATLSHPLTAEGLGGWLQRAAPGIPRDLGFGLVVSFAFAQSVHYGLWLRAVPEDDRRQATPRSFRSSYRALVVEMGAVPLVLTAALGLGVAIWGAYDLSLAREGYLRLAGFHAYLEVAVGALWWAERRRPCAVNGHIRRWQDGSASIEKGASNG